MNFLYNQHGLGNCKNRQLDTVERSVESVECLWVFREPGRRLRLWFGNYWWGEGG